jgi:hypothetical protein
MNRLLVAAAAAWAIWAAAPAGADPTVQQLQPSLPSTPERDGHLLDDLAKAGIRVTSWSRQAATMPVFTSTSVSGSTTAWYPFTITVSSNAIGVIAVATPSTKSTLFSFARCSRISR